ncbi:MAG: hypothetical protein P1P88_06820 [Bacteroidales bacterium]|nr:hypothetical protein [Bacteroidales bacterium]
MDQKPLTWLLKTNNPSLKYRVLTELLDYQSDHPSVLEQKKLIPDSNPVKSIFEKMHPDGYWLQTNPRTKNIVGDGVEYGSFASTHFCLSYLSELGLTKEHILIAKAADRYLSLQKDDGDFWLHMSCLYAYNIRTFIKLGYRDDPRLQKTIDLMLNTERQDHGYLCEMHEKKTNRKKSCIRGSAKALMAFAELPEYWKHPRCLALVDYFLKRNGIFKSNCKDLVNRDMNTFSFPFTWGTNSWEILFALSKMGYGNHKNLHPAWQLLENKKNEDGTYNLDHTPSQSPWKVGKKGEANGWVTFYILLAKKLKHSGLD